MSNRQRRRPDQYPAWLRLIVQSALAQAQSEGKRYRPGPAGLDSYLAFSREFFLSLRRRPDPYLGMRSRRIIMKWFARGLSGRVLHLVEQAIVEWLFPPKAASQRHRKAG